MSDFIDIQEDDNVIDFIAEKLLRHCDEAETSEEADLAEVMYEAYMDGRVLAKMVNGEMLFTLPENQLTENTRVNAWPDECAGWTGDLDQEETWGPLPRPIN